MTLRFEAGAWRALVAAVREAYPDEACGVCLSRATSPHVIHEVRALRNVAAEPRSAFAFDEREHLSLLQEVEARGAQVRAFFHSHPDGDAALSPRDLEGALVDGQPLWPGVDWIVVATRGRAAHASRRFTFARDRALPAPLELDAP